MTDLSLIHIYVYKRQVIVSGGKLGTQIILAPDDLIKVTRADVCDLSLIHIYASLRLPP